MTRRTMEEIWQDIIETRHELARWGYAYGSDPLYLYRRRRLKNLYREWNRAKFRDWKLRSQTPGKKVE